MRKFEEGYAIYDGDDLAILSFRIPVFWHKKSAQLECPKGFQVRKVKIMPINQSKGGQS